MNPDAKISRTEAIERLSKSLAEARAQLELATAQMKAGGSPGKYVLNLQIGALKKRIHACKAHIARIQKDPRNDVTWSDRLSA